MTAAAATNVAAMAAAISEAAEGSYDINTPSNRRSMTSGRGAVYKSEGGGSSLGEIPLSGSGSGDARALIVTSKAKYSAGDGSAIADEMPSSEVDDNAVNNKGRARRASEGAHLIKGEGKRISGGELRCEKCGKGYKHSSCLTKHLSVPIVSLLPKCLPFGHFVPFLFAIDLRYHFLASRNMTTWI